MSASEISKEEIQAVFPKVAATLADALGCDVEQVTLDIPLIEGLEAESFREEWSKEKSGFTLGVLVKASGRLIGHATCDGSWDPHSPSVSVVIAPSQQRGGYGSEALHLLVAHLFLDTPAHTITGWMAGWNEPALAFAAASGFTECGRIPRAGLRGGAYYDQVVVELLRREWAAR